MDIVDLDEMGLIDSSGDFIHGFVDTSIFCPDGAISISSEDLNTFGTRMTYVTIPNLVQIVQDGNTSNVSYIINNNQISSVSQPSIVLNEDGIVEFTEPASPLKENNEDLQTQISDYLKPPAYKALLAPSDADKVTPKDNNQNSTSSEKRVPIAMKQDVDPPDKTGNMTCDKCNAQFNSWTLFKRHMWMHLHEKPFQCTFCHESFNYELNLNLHLATHNSDNPFCPICKKSFNRIASLKAHIMLHEREESLFCNECGEEFASPIYLERHMAEHRTEKNKGGCPGFSKVYRCRQCDEDFDSAASYRLHRIKNHMKKILKLKRRTGSKGNRCEFCQKCFDKPSQLLRHKRIHTGERPYKCEVCSRAFSQKGSLRIHMLKHTRERPYVCQFCHGTFSQKGNLQAHVRRLHMEPKGNEKVYKCNECTCIFRKLGSLNAHFNKCRGSCKKDSCGDNQKVDSSSDSSNKENENSKKESEPGEIVVSDPVEGENQEGKVCKGKIRKKELCSICKKRPRDMSRHIKLHTVEKSFKCNFCDKTFPLQSTLSVHMKTHIEKKRYTCPTCKKSYSTVRNLKLHRKKHIMACEDSSDKNNEVNVEEPQIALDVNPAPLVCLDQVDMSSLDATSSNNIILTDSEVEHRRVQGNSYSLKSGNIVDMNNDVEDDENAVTSYRCFECNMVFKKEIHLQIHLQIHNSTPFSCEHCPCTFNSRNTLNMHVRQQHLAVKHVCSVCNTEFPSESSLKRHEVVHSQVDSTWICPLCGVTFKSYPSGKKHISIKHPNESKATMPIRLVETPNEKNDQETGTDLLNSKSSLPIVVMNEQNDIQTTLKNILTVPSDQLYIIAHDDGAYIIPSKSITETGELEEYPVILEDPVILNTSESTNSQKQVFENPLETCIFTFQEENEIGNSIINANIPTIISQSPEINRCDMTDLLISNVSDFSVDKSTPVIEKPHNCMYTLCEESFSSSIEYEEHLKIHKIPKNGSKIKSRSADIKSQQTALFSCGICSKKFMTFDDCTDHQDVHMNQHEKKNRCDGCTAEFVTPQELQDHMNEHVSIEVIKCYLCCMEFNSQEKFQNHCHKYHSSQGVVSEKKKSRPNWRPPARRLTEEETKVLSTIEPDNASEKVLLQSLLEKQRFEHPVKEEPKPQIVHLHKCKYCPKSFRKPSDLIRHLRTHTGEKPYKCIACNKRFSIKSAASSHMKTHTKDKSYECYVCSKLFASTGSLKIHMRLHTGLKPFACHLCDAKFRTSGHKTAHLLTHQKISQEESEKKGMNPDKILSKNSLITSSNIPPSGTGELTFPADDMNSVTPGITCPDQGSQYLVPLKPGVRDMSSHQTKTDEFLMSFKLPEQEVGQGGDKGNQSSKTSKFLLNINDEGGGNGETPRYFLSIKDGGTGEDGFVLESISDDQIIVTITKGDSDIPKLPSQIESGISQEQVIIECFTCIYCKNTFSKQNSLDKHIKKFHSQELFHCTVCLESFQRKSELDVHCLAHELDREITCSECGECFSLEEELRAHKCMKSVTLDLSMEHDLFLFLKGDYKLVQSPGSLQTGDG